MVNVSIYSLHTLLCSPLIHFCLDIFLSKVCSCRLPHGAVYPVVYHYAWQAVHSEQPFWDWHTVSAAQRLVDAHKHKHTHRRRAEHKYMHSCRLQHVGEVAGRTPPLSCQTNDNLINSFWFWFCEIRCPWDKLDQKRLRHDHSNNAIQCLYNEGHFCFSFYWHQFWISFK